jgi:dTDP-4-dehydrorhamnose 3,5-epimerase-like enzyme
MAMQNNIPKIIDGGIAIDDRGQLSFVNDFNFQDVKRFYMVSNHSSGFVRAWHGHKKEAKYVFVTKGAAIVGTVKIDNWENPSKKIQVSRFILTANKPSILWIPSGYANGFKTLTSDTQLIFFSTSTLKDSQGDDFRYDSRYWDVWDIEER